MKKLLTVACGLVIATSLFVSCNKKSEAKGKGTSQVTLNVMGYGDNSNSE